MWRHIVSERTIEEYVESIGALEELASPVSTSSIAQLLGVSQASVSEMLHRLSEKGLVEYTPYGGTVLTEDGRQRFLKLTRHHRLWEVFLNKYLNISWEDVYQHACSLEHATSELVADKLADFLNHPGVCPHGCPIPDGKLHMSKLSGIPLVDFKVGQAGKMHSILCGSQIESMHYLAGMGIRPGILIKVVDRAPIDDTLLIEVDGSIKALGPQVASMVMVEPV